ncbi:MAG TPA: hypothetical protein VN924_19010 [Bryobacteraceae bacterium]|jgi:hypothetical protein|nr:hypothetical protein [Bryobacteraceae bacterium]
MIGRVAGVDKMENGAPPAAGRRSLFAGGVALLEPSNPGVWATGGDPVCVQAN